MALEDRRRCRIASDVGNKPPYPFNLIIANNGSEDPGFEGTKGVG